MPEDEFSKSPMLSVFYLSQLRGRTKGETTHERA
jgi:hypothetical protein